MDLHGFATAFEGGQPAEPDYRLFEAALDAARQAAGSQASCAAIAACSGSFNPDVAQRLRAASTQMTVKFTFAL